MGLALALATLARILAPADRDTHRSRLPGEGFVWMGVVVLLAVRLVLSVHAIARPGLQQDETLFVNAATLRVPHLYMPVTFHGLPVMIFPYIGALKSWLYEPVFAIFGNSASSIRVPVIVIVTLGLALVYPAVRDLAGRPVAILAFVLLCFDNSVFWLTRDDVGPSAIEFFLKCAVLFCASRLLSRRSYLWLALLLLSLALGVYNKLNFIWVINAAVAVSVLIALRYRTSIRPQWPKVAAWLVGLVVIYAAFAWYYVSHHIGSLLAPAPGASITQPWAQFSRGTSEILSGTWFYDYALVPQEPRMVVVWLTIGLFAAGLIGSVVPARTRNLAVAAIGVATVLIALQVLFTLQATAGWHYIAIYPFVTIVASYGVYVLARLASARGLVARAALVAAALAGLVYSGLLMSKYFDALGREPVNSAWTPAIYRLSRDLRRTRAQIYTADWGLLNPLFALRPGFEYTELAFAFEAPFRPALYALGKSLESAPGPKLVVTHPPYDLVFPHADANLFKTLGSHLHLDFTVDGSNHVPVYDVYAFR